MQAAQTLDGGSSIDLDIISVRKFDYAYIKVISNVR